MALAHSACKVRQKDPALRITDGCPRDQSEFVQLWPSIRCHRSRYAPRNKIPQRLLPSAHLCPLSRTQKWVKNALWTVSRKDDPSASLHTGRPDEPMATKVISADFRLSSTKMRKSSDNKAGSYETRD